MSEPLIKCQERFDIKRLYYIINNFDNLTVGFDEEKKKSMLSQANRYLQKSCIINGVGTCNVEYVQKKVFENYQGRFFVKHIGLQSMSKYIRHCIAGEYYVDIDMVNCHPNLLVFICKKNNIITPVLKSFIKNRKLFVDELVNIGYTEDQAKTTYLSLINGGTKDYNDAIEKMPGKSLLESFKKETVSILNRLSKKFNNEFEHIKKNKSSNPKGSLVNHLLCELENNILMKIYEHIGKPSDCVLCFDGMMIPHKLFGNINLNEIQMFIKAELGVNIELISKPMDKGFNITNEMIASRQDIDKRVKCKDLLFHLINENRVSIADYADLFCILYSDSIMVNDDESFGYMWIESEKIWKLLSYKYLCLLGTELLRSILDEVKTYYLQIQENEKPDKRIRLVYKYYDLFNGPRNMREMLFYAKKHLSDNTSIINTQHNLLPIANGKIIELDRKIIRDRIKTDLFTFECPVEYVDDITDEDRVMFNKYVGSIYGHNSDYIEYKQIKFGSYLCGHNYSRKLDVEVGCGKNGKSTILKSLNAILTDNFFGYISRDVIVSDPKSHKKDGGSSHTSYLIPIVNRRVIVTEEIRENDELISDIVKKIASSDKIAGVREAYGKKTITIKPFCKLIIDSNYVPKYNISDTAIIDRMILHPYSTRFLTDEELKIEKDNDKYKPQKYNYARADIDLIEQFATPGRCLNVLFSWMVDGCLKYYTLDNHNLTIPSIVKDHMNLHFNEINIVKSFINEIYFMIKGEKIEKIDKILLKKCKIPAAEIWNDFKDWGAKNGVLSGYTYKRLITELEFNGLLSCRVDTCRGFKYITHITNIKLIEEIKLQSSS
jgi:phage/plasmid-associated DNA primase